MVDPYRVVAAEPDQTHEAAEEFCDPEGFTLDELEALITKELEEDGI
jgi:hypothetical protein